MVRIERHVGAAGLEDGEQSDHHFGRPLHADTHQYLGPYAQRDQVVGQLIGARVEFGVGELLVLEHQRHRIWAAPDLLLKQLVNALVPGVVGRRVVPLHQ